jgi:hypothetical protein
MAIECRARPEHNLAILVHVGRIPDEEFLAFYKALYERGTLHPSMNLLVDLREADSRPRSSGVLRHLAEFMQVTYTDTTTRPKVAVVAPKDLSFGLAKMYGAFADSVPWEFVAFRAMDAALAWLGLPEDFLNRHGQDAQPRAEGDAADRAP